MHPITLYPVHRMGRGKGSNVRENAHEPHRLTRRERELLQLLTKGHSNKKIGAALGIQEQTVKNALSLLSHKLHARNRVQLAVAGVRLLDQEK